MNDKRLLQDEKGSIRTKTVIRVCQALARPEAANPGCPKRNSLPFCRFRQFCRQVE